MPRFVGNSLLRNTRRGADLGCIGCRLRAFHVPQCVPPARNQIPHTEIARDQAGRGSRAIEAQKPPTSSADPLDPPREVTGVAFSTAASSTTPPLPLRTEQR